MQIAGIIFQTRSYLPRPAVGSAVIRLTRYQEKPVKVNDSTFMFKIIRASFNQRRKTLQNGLYNSSELRIPKEKTVAALEEMGLLRQFVEKSFL